jgi:hypothetical protein
MVQEDTVLVLSREIYILHVDYEHAPEKVEIPLGYVYRKLTADGIL